MRNFYTKLRKEFEQLSAEGKQDVLNYIEFLKYKGMREMLEKVSNYELVAEMKRRDLI